MTRPLILLTAFTLLLPLTGCGKKLTPVTGVVTLDGKAVAGASVTLISEDGKDNPTALTDDSGNFTVESRGGPGAHPGNYKVVVAKYPKVEGAVSPADQEAGKVDKDYAKQMMKEADAGKAGKAGKVGAGKMPPGMPMPGGSSVGSGAKSELPEVYASSEKTPLTIKVPADGPIKLELNSKP